MAIAFDTAANGAITSTSLTYSHTCSGSNRILLAGVVNVSGIADRFTGVTYASVAMTRIAGIATQNTFIAVYQLINPTSGANDIVVSTNTSLGIRALSASYTGVLQSGSFIDNYSATATVSNPRQTTKSLTTNADNCWVVCLADNNGQALSIVSGATWRTNRGAQGDKSIWIDSNAAVTPAGSYSMSVQVPTNDGNEKTGMIMISLAPAASVATFIPQITII